MGKCTLVWVLVISATLRVAHLQFPPLRNGVSSCDIPSPDIFGSSDAAGSRLGIVANGFGSGDQGTTEAQMVRIEEVNTVCEASGKTKYSVSSISAIVKYECLDTQCGGMGLLFIEQYRLDCLEEDGVASFSGVVSGNIINTEGVLVGNLSTPLMDQCGQCVVPATIVPSDPATYCLACEDECVGLGKCLGNDGGQCCNYYLDDDCVITCPESLMPNADFDCTCEELTAADNAGIVYSNFQFVGSIATETCDTGNGYILAGSDPVADFEAAGTRTCTESGWSGNAIACTLHDCLTTSLEGRPENVQLTVGPTVFGSVATFSCDADFNLVNGDAMRTCQLTGWSGTNPECVADVTTPLQSIPTPGESSSCGTECIVGIVFAVLGAIILAAILAGVAYAIYMYMNHPDTKLAKYDPDNINGIAKDNPLYVDPDAVVGAEAA